MAFIPISGLVILLTQAMVMTGAGAAAQNNRQVVGLAHPEPQQDAQRALRGCITRGPGRRKCWG